MSDLRHVTSWIFDMDDCLYPRAQGVMRLVQERINAFMMAADGGRGSSVASGRAGPRKRRQKSDSTLAKMRVWKRTSTRTSKSDY